MLAFTSCDVTPPFRCSDALCQTRRMDHRELFHEAMQGTDAHVRTVTDADLSRATPCEGWTVADLLAHMIGQQDGWAAAVTDGDAPPSAYAPVPFTQAAWRASADRLLHAFDGADLAATVVVRALTPRPLPAPVVIGAQLLDTAVHGWDLARALGRDHTPPEPVVAAVAAVAGPIPDDESRVTQGFFARAVGDGPADLSTWPGVLAHLGRDPGWQPPA